MQTDIPILFVEINESNYIFVAGIYDDNQNLEIIEKIITPNEGIYKNKFINIEIYNDLPTVFGNGKNFYSLYQDLQNIKFPLETIKSFYFFESGRWDLIMHDDKVIKLPINNYLFSLKNFMLSKANSNFNNYKIFDYRIKDQLILN